MLFSHKSRSERANARAVAVETLRHHAYGLELIADGFVSPIVLASDRLTELRGEMNMQQFAAYTGLSEFELGFLLDNEHLEPTCKQVMTVSSKTGRSLLWLLGYHVPPEARLGSGDMEVAVALNKRNAAEATLRCVPAKGVVNDLIRRSAEKRVERTNRELSFTAARIVTRLHHPLDNRDIMRMKGQPVYIEFANRPAEVGIWGISLGSAILTGDGKMALKENGEAFLVYQTPKI